MVCTWLIDSDQFESAQVQICKAEICYEAVGSILMLLSVCPPGQSGVFW